MEERDRLDVSKISLISVRFIRWKVSKSFRKIRISYPLREKEREREKENRYIFKPNRGRNFDPRENDSNISGARKPGKLLKRQLSPAACPSEKTSHPRFEIYNMMVSVWFRVWIL